MIVVMKTSATEQQIVGVQKAIRELGFKDHRIHGEERIVFYSIDQQSKQVVGFYQPFFHDRAVSLPEKRLTQRAQQIAIYLQSGAAHGSLLARQMKQPLGRKAELPGHSLQRQGLGVSVEHLPGMSAPKC